MNEGVIKYKYSLGYDDIVHSIESNIGNLISKPVDDKEPPERIGILGKIARHREICDELHELYKRKNHDYSDSFHQTYLEEGLAMARIRLSDKLNRFKTLSKAIASNSDAQKITDESMMRDTLIDLANYAIMTILELEKETEANLNERG